MKPLAQLVRPNILALQPYSTARDEYAGGGIGVWLDANESPYDNGVNRYPDPHQRELKAQLAALKDVRSGQIFRRRRNRRKTAGNTAFSARWMRLIRSLTAWDTV